MLAPCLAVDVTSEPIAEATLRQLTERFGGAVREAETFRLMWALDEHDLPVKEIANRERGAFIKRARGKLEDGMPTA